MNFDCNDNDPTSNPEAAEVCNDVDDDCDGEKDEGLPTSRWYLDTDGGRRGRADSLGDGCGAPPAGSVTSTGDCNDKRDVKIRPGVRRDLQRRRRRLRRHGRTTACVSSFYPDVDGDGFGDAMGAPQSSCLTSVMGKVPNKSDCADRDPTVKPGATEIATAATTTATGRSTTDHLLSYYPDVDGTRRGRAARRDELRPGRRQGDERDRLATTRTRRWKPGAPRCATASTTTAWAASTKASPSATTTPTSTVTASARTSLR